MMLRISRTPKNSGTVALRYVMRVITVYLEVSLMAKANLPRRVQFLTEVLPRDLMESMLLIPEERYNLRNYR